MIAARKGNMGNEADPTWSRCEHRQQGNTMYFVLCVCVTPGTNTLGTRLYKIVTHKAFWWS